MRRQEIVLIEPVRTAIGAFNGCLKTVPATQLGATVLRETVSRAGLEPGEIGSVTMGNVIQAGNRMNPARQAAIHAGLPVSVPAMTVNRVCGSGAQAIVTAAQEILAGAVPVALAGGMENMDRAPYLLDNGRWGYRMGPAEIMDSMLTDGLNDAFSGLYSGWHIEDLVMSVGLTRTQQDAFALRSQLAFSAAQAAGRFDGEIVGVEINTSRGKGVFARDEAPCPGTTLDALARLTPALSPDGTLTSGNAPGVNAGAAAMVVSDRAWAEKHGLKPAARLAGYGVAAAEPEMFGMSPVPAVEKALTHAGWTLGQLERIEINEAFAAVPLAVMQALGLPEDIVNPEGGAIAHGHAIGATGAVLVTRLVHAMQREGLARGMVTLCIGGGQGIALAIERVA
ncbi:thiolase family protein [Roseinatronobacter alkalisoli]|uniref:Thiolase family protein n=1 Tax=Roseinatronobacter alkalisoli TaxID=3028235 RepID=A0ABT5TEC3_9RHOB|nr:thiolase family protein [Roseinatronobacter sp. HJB301]MDD7973466.1 thiolase family protein [Roseinatronobacter sp. HJB301]